jgi:hypothetical protein
MRAAIFTICLLLAIGLAFCCGWFIGPYETRVQLAEVRARLESEQERDYRQEWWVRESDFRTICLLDEQKAAEVKHEYDQRIDMWIIENCCNSRSVPFPDIGDGYKTISLLSRLARHRQRYPVTHQDGVVAQTISNVLAKALDIDTK